MQTHLYYPWFEKYGDRIHDIPDSRGEPYKHICIILGLTSMEIEYTIFHTPEESHTNTFVLSLVIHDIPHSRGEPYKHICIILGLTSMEI